MQIHNLTSHIRSHPARRIGRGGKRGTYSGRGIKGQKARAGAKFRPEERDTLKRIPKLRGYRFKSFQTRPVVVSLRVIEEKFPSGSEITPKALLEKGLIRNVRGGLPRVKILGGGHGTKTYSFKNVLLSGTIAGKIEVKK